MNGPFQHKVFVGLVWLTRNHMIGSGDFWDKSPSWFLKIDLPNMWLLVLIDVLMISYIGSALFSRKDLKNIVPDLFVKAFEIIELPRELKHHPFVNRIKRLGIPLAKKENGYIQCGCTCSTFKQSSVYWLGNL